MTKSRILSLIRIWIGLWLLVPGILKVINLSGLAKIVAINWAVLIPEILLPPMQYILPFIEVIIGFLVTFGFFTIYTSIIYAGMHLIFVGITMYALIAGIFINDCGCYGTFIPNPVSIGGLGKDMTFLFLSIIVFLSYFKNPSDSLKDVI